MDVSKHGVSEIQETPDFFPFVGNRAVSSKGLFTLESGGERKRLECMLGYTTFLPVHFVQQPKGGGFHHKQDLK